MHRTARVDQLRVNRAIWGLDIMTKLDSIEARVNVPKPNLSDLRSEWMELYELSKRYTKRERLMMYRMVNDFITRTFPLLHYIVLQAELELSAVLRELELASIHQELFELLSENPQLIDEFDENPEEHERKAAALRPRSKQMGSRHM